MTLISDIISDAFRESNLTAIGTAPTTAENTEALRLLNRYINALIGTDLGEPLEDASVGLNNITRQSGEQQLFTSVIDTSFLPLNMRVIANPTEAQTIYLHPSPWDGARLGVTNPSNNLATYNLTFNGNGKLIESGQSVVLNTNGLNREWFYRADLSEWVRLTSLTLVDSSPFPSEFDDVLILGLAVRNNPRQGIVMDAQSQSYMMAIRSKFKARYRQTKSMPSEQGLLRLSANNHMWNSYGDASDFYTGYTRVN